MAGRFVRASKYRHVFGVGATSKKQTYDNLRISKNAWDTNLVKANPKYLAVNWEASGGGAFAVIPLEEKGKLPEQIPIFRGHTAAVLDADFSPFNDDIVASGSDDGKVFLWKVPEDFSLHTDADEPADVKPVGKLSGHSRHDTMDVLHEDTMLIQFRKVGHVLFNPAAENVLASSSGDFLVKVWDLEDGKSKLTLKHNDIVQSLSWSANGTMLVTTSRDKKLRFWDVRQEKPAHEVPGHSGAKNSRCVWMGEHDRVATTGFSKMSERQLGLWDVKNPSKPVGGDFNLLDSSSGVGMPFWDDGCQMLYLAGKGDGNIRYFEFENDKFEPLSEYKSGDPQRGLAFMPKRGVNTQQNEIMRAYKTVNDQYIEPISFIVPRRAEVFQDDIYPPTVGLKPAMSSDDWFEGKTALPPKVSMEDMYEGQEPKEVASEEVPKPSAPRSAPEPAPAPASATKSEPRIEKPDPTPTMATEMPSVDDTKKSMADMASKFADKKDGEEEEEEDTSSFEEVQKPVERPAAAWVGRQEAQTSLKDEKIAPVPEPDKTTKTAPAERQAPAAFGGEGLSTPAQATSIPASELPKSEEKPAESASQSVAAPAPAASSAAGGLRDILQDMRGMLQTQSRQIQELTEAIAALKARVGE